MRWTGARCRLWRLLEVGVSKAKAKRVFTVRWQALPQPDGLERLAMAMKLLIGRGCEVQDRRAASARPALKPPTPCDHDIAKESFDETS